jgi:hypothetical protein
MGSMDSTFYSESEIGEKEQGTMDGWDGIKLCEKCGEYTTGRLCRACQEQEMIDNALPPDDVGMYQDDEWWDEDDPDDYDDWDDYEEPEPRPLTVLERFGVWFSRTWIGRYWRARYAVDRRRFDLDNLPF